MARHRNIRSMDISDEYDGYDDVYGHSVEDDYCVSPSVASEYLYDREGARKSQNMQTFLKEHESIEEEDEIDSAAIPHKLLSENLEEQKLQLCLDKIKENIGDIVPYAVLIKIAHKHNYDPEKTLKAVLAESNHGNVQNIPINKGLENVTKKISNSANSKSLRNDHPVKIIPQALNVTKGFEVMPYPDKDRTIAIITSPRSQSPASGRATPNEGRSTPEIVRVKENKIDPLTLYKKERSNDKQHLYMVVIGHVDAGKSTLMGHVLCALGQVSQRTLHKYEQESRKLGKQSFLYAWVLDETGEERARGITMDVGRSQFETTTKKIILLDAPGHKDFIPNMIVGAGQADVALLVVDATRGEFETGFEMGGQTREHALLVRSLGVGQLAVAVNKLDTVDWSQERFDEISAKLGAFLKQAGFREKDVTFIPCSGLTGQNLVKKPTEDGLLKWYKGPCLIDVIDNFKTPERPVNKPFRMSVNDVFKGTGSGICVDGKIETGSLSAGERILISPTRESATVRSLLLNDMPQQIAFAGDQVSLTLIGDVQNATVGCVLCTPSNPIPIVTKFEARIVVFNLTVPITKGYSVVLHHQSLIEPAYISKLISQLHKSTGEIVKKRPRCLGNNSSALVEITVHKPICVELYRDIKELGRVMLRVAGVTIAAGLITGIVE